MFEGLDGFREQSLPIKLVGDIEVDVVRGRPDVGGHGLAFGVEHVGHDDSGTLGGEEAGLGFAHAT